MANKLKPVRSTVGGKPPATQEELYSQVNEVFPELPSITRESLLKELDPRRLPRQIRPRRLPPDDSPDFTKGKDGKIHEVQREIRQPYQRPDGHPSMISMYVPANIFKRLDAVRSLIGQKTGVIPSRSHIVRVMLDKGLSLFEASSATP